jgi:hypothetical protein
MAEIARAPLAWPRVRGDARRRLVRRFPFAVIYLVEPQHIEVLALKTGKMEMVNFQP